MGDYGACAEKLSKARPAEALASAPGQQKDGCGAATDASSPSASAIFAASWRLILKPGEPLFLENPDGSISEGTRLAADGQRRPAKPGNEASEGEEAEGSVGDAAARNLANEMDYLLHMHEYGFMIVCFLQLTMEMLYNVIYVVRLGASTTELIATYDHKISPAAATLLLQVIFIFHLVYDCIYYFLAYYAVYSRKPRDYQRFYAFAMLGIASLVLFTYVGKFNLPLFLLRTLAYVYGRYLQGLTTSRVILPMVTQQQRAADVLASP